MGGIMGLAEICRLDLTHVSFFENVCHMRVSLANLTDNAALVLPAALISLPRASNHNNLLTCTATADDSGDVIGTRVLDECYSLFRVGAGHRFSWSLPDSGTIHF